MKLTYRLERHDQAAFQWHHFWRSTSRYLPITLLLGVAILSYGFYERGLQFHTAVTYLAGYILLMVLIYAVTIYLTLNLIIRRSIPPGDNNGVIGDHCLVFDDAGIYEQAGPVETKVKWSIIRKVSVGENHAFLYFAPNKAFIVPKRAFVTESEFNRFISDCVSRI